MDVNLSPRAKRALMHRGPFREALTWLEIHGEAPDVVEHWRGFIEAAGAYEGDGPEQRQRRRGGGDSRRRRRVRRRRPRRGDASRLRLGLRRRRLSPYPFLRSNSRMNCTSASTPSSRKRVVDRGAHAADRAMALEAVEARGGRFLLERLLELLARQTERHVHQRAALLLRRAAIEAGAIDLGVQRRRLALVHARDRRQPAERLQPLHRQAEDVDAERIRRVVERVVLRLHLVIQHRRQIAVRPWQQILADDHQRDAGRTEILLRAGVDEAEPRDVDRAG